MTHRFALTDCWMLKPVKHSMIDPFWPRIAGTGEAPAGQALCPAHHL